MRLTTLDTPVQIGSLTVTALFGDDDYITAISNDLWVSYNVILCGLSILAIGQLIQQGNPGGMRYDRESLKRCIIGAIMALDGAGLNKSMLTMASVLVLLLLPCSHLVLACNLIGIERNIAVLSVVTMCCIIMYYNKVNVEASVFQRLIYKRRTDESLDEHNAEEMEIAKSYVLEVGMWKAAMHIVRSSLRNFMWGCRLARYNFECGLGDVAADPADGTENVPNPKVRAFMKLGAHRILYLSSGKVPGRESEKWRTDLDITDLPEGCYKMQVHGGFKEPLGRPSLAVIAEGGLYEHERQDIVNTLRMQKLYPTAIIGVDEKASNIEGSIGRGANQWQVESLFLGYILPIATSTLVTFSLCSMHYSSRHSAVFHILDLAHGLAYTNIVRLNLFNTSVSSIGLVIAMTIIRLGVIKALSLTPLMVDYSYRAIEGMTMTTLTTHKVSSRDHHLTMFMPEEALKEDCKLYRCADNVSEIGFSWLKFREGSECGILNHLDERGQLVNDGTLVGHGEATGRYIRSSYRAMHKSVKLECEAGRQVDGKNEDVACAIKHEQPVVVLMIAC